MKVFINMGGGLGDLYRCYFVDGNNGDRFWGRLEQIEDINNYEITIIGATHNIQECERFLANHPLIKSIHLEPWQQHGYFLIDRFKEQGYKPIGEVINWTQYEWKRPRVYLTDEEIDIVARIPRPYVVLYPFLGCPSIQPWPVEKYYPLIDQLISQGIFVVILGGTYLREWTDPEKGYMSVLIEQKFDHPGVLNFMGIGSRISAQLVIESDAFIGAFGCYTMVSYAHEKTTIVLHEDVIKRHLENTTIINDKWAINEPYSHLIHVNNKSDEEITNKIREVLNGIR